MIALLYDKSTEDQVHEMLKLLMENKIPRENIWEFIIPVTGVYNIHADEKVQIMKFMKRCLEIRKQNVSARKIMNKKDKN